MREENGFTLIELIVVILILAILAGIAIPVFLRQKDKGWNAQVKSTVRNAATAQESFAIDNGGIYSDTVADLIDEGLRFGASDVDFEDADITAVGSTSYCMEAASVRKPTIVWHHDSDIGKPVEGSCTP